MVLRRAALSKVLLALSLCGLSTDASLGFDLEGHRGARGLAPENTLAAFHRAIEIGVTTIETDLAVTRDAVSVISHDPFLNPDIVRGPDGRWLTAKGPPIRSLTYAELSRYDIGRIDPERVPTPERFPNSSTSMDSVFQSWPSFSGSARQARNRSASTSKRRARRRAARTLPTLRPSRNGSRMRYGNAKLDDRVRVQSFDWRTLIEVKRIAPGIETSCLTIQTRDNDTASTPDGAPSPWHAGFALQDHGGSLPATVKAAGCGVWSMFWRNLTAKELAETHALGLKVLPWTVNERAEMRRLIDLGVDGIVTDYPDRLRGVMADMGMPLP